MTIVTLFFFFIFSLSACIYFSFLYQKMGLYSLGKIDLFVLRCLCFYVYMFFMLIAVFSVHLIAFSDFGFFSTFLKDDLSSEFSVYFSLIPIACFLTVFVYAISDFIYDKYLDKVLKNSVE